MSFKDKNYNREYQKLWARKKLKEQQALGKRREVLLKTKYGMSIEDWDQLFEKQGKCCAICECKEPKSKVGWHTDHDHNTGKVRGILCENCNRGLGMYEDDITFLRSAASYLGVYSGILPGIELEEVITPFVERSVQNGKSYGKTFAGYDIRLDQDIILSPKEFKLGSSMEYFQIPLNCVAMICDKSSHARQGLSLFNTIAEPGWRGYLTLELVNHSDNIIILNKGEPIAQVLFLPMDRPVEIGYTGKYQDQQRGPQEARFE